MQYALTQRRLHIVPYGQAAPWNTIQTKGSLNKTYTLINSIGFAPTKKQDHVLVPVASGYVARFQEWGGGGINIF